MYVWYFVNQLQYSYSNIFNVQFKATKFHEGEETI